MTTETTRDDLLEACMELVLANIDEDAHRSNDYLVFSCRECGGEAEDDHTRIPHEEDCRVGKAEAAIAKAYGQ